MDGWTMRRSTCEVEKGAPPINKFFDCFSIVHVSTLLFQEERLIMNSSTKILRCQHCRTLDRPIGKLVRFLVRPGITSKPRRFASAMQRLLLSQPSSVPFAFAPNKTMIRYQTTTSKGGDETKHGSSKEKEDAEEERLLENVEEIVEIPSSAFHDLIDRSKYTEVVPVRMPDLGTSHDNAPDRCSLVKEWFFAPGSVIQRQDVLCDIQTPEFTFGMETDDEELAILGEILVPAGQPVPDGTVLCNLYHEAKGNAPATAVESSPMPMDDDEDDDDAAAGSTSQPEEDDEDDDPVQPKNPDSNKP